MSRERWTHEDERMLASLVERKNRVTAANMVPLVKLAEELIKETTAGNLAEALAATAEELRDALEPFDSGIRVAPNEWDKP